ncbi:hypothetical protein GTO89_06855 [Heliobacterium gestii]|uniref:Tetratricopeptide repeat protein n=1 Tax=Heliomicrobium gestii TaxID=2699 RepID=A0A845LDQ7_HELGE|nr:hypothetical protein [Heliomicrobium gestii]MBM7866457.1 tetratricopeptide (TPR) repeat protein [Heliomicrobium gestii]MZP42759.1 hypothetical protein [Heliomicrobium gestii]
MEQSAVECRDGCLAAYARGDCALALELVDQGLARYDDYPDLYFLKGTFLQALGLLPQAAASFSRCARIRQIPPGYPSWDGITGYPALYRLAELTARIGAVDDALAVLQQAWAARRDPPFDDLARFARHLGDRGLEAPAIAGLLQQRLALDDAAAARLLCRLGDYGAALHRLGQNTAAPAKLCRGFCHLALGQDEEAETELAGIPFDSPSGGKALIGRLIGLSRRALVPPLAIIRLLGEYAAAQGHLAVARERLSFVLAEGADPSTAAAIHACLGRLEDAWGDGDAAFLHGLSALRLAPEQREWAAAAVEQALTQCRRLVADALTDEGESADLRHTAVQLLSTHLQIRRVREAPVDADKNP